MCYKETLSFTCRISLWLCTISPQIHIPGATITYWMPIAQDMVAKIHILIPLSKEKHKWRDTMITIIFSIWTFYPTAPNVVIYNNWGFEIKGPYCSNRDDRFSWWDSFLVSVLCGMQLYANFFHEMAIKGRTQIKINTEMVLPDIQDQSNFKILLEYYFMW